MGEQGMERRAAGTRGKTGGREAVHDQIVSIFCQRRPTPALSHLTVPPSPSPSPAEQRNITGRWLNSSLAPISPPPPPPPSRPCLSLFVRTSLSPSIRVIRTVLAGQAARRGATRRDGWTDAVKSRYVKRIRKAECRINSAAAASHRAGKSHRGRARTNNVGAVTASAGPTFSRTAEPATRQRNRATSRTFIRRNFRGISPLTPRKCERKLI